MWSIPTSVSSATSSSTCGTVEGKYCLFILGTEIAAVGGVMAVVCLIHRQEIFMENYFTTQRDNVFRNVEVLIYVFDVESREVEKDMHYYQSCLEAILQVCTHYLNHSSLSLCVCKFGDSCLLPTLSFCLSNRKSYFGNVTFCLCIEFSWCKGVLSDPQDGPNPRRPAENGEFSSPHRLLPHTQRSSLYFVRYLTSVRQS